MPSARPKLEMSTVAPCSCATFAVAKPMELSIVTPATRMRLPSRIPPMSVPHSKSTVDRDHCPGDVRRAGAGQPQHGLCDVFNRAVRAERHLRLDRGLLLVGEHPG